MTTSTRLILFLASALLCLCLQATPALADVASSIANGRKGLQEHNLAAARAGFDAAVAADPAGTDPLTPEANVLDGVAKFLQLETDPAAQSLLDKLGVGKAGRDVFRWKPKMAKQFNTPLMTDAFQPYAQQKVLPQLAAIDLQLQKAGSAFLMTLTAVETGGREIKVDYGDVLLLRSELAALVSGLKLTAAYNMNLKLGDIGNWLPTNAMTMQKLLATYPNLLKMKNGPGAQDAIATFRGAFSIYESASAFIRGRTDNTERLFVLDPSSAPAEEAFRTKIGLVRDSLAAATALDPDTQVFAGAFRDAPKDLRSVLPSYQDNHAVQFPDLTFAGTLPNLGRTSDSGRPWADRVTLYFAQVSHRLDRLFRHRDDPVDPKLKITAPLPAQKLTYAGADAVTIKGTASDNIAVTGLEVRAGSGPMKNQLLPVTFSGSGKTIGWAATMPVISGPQKVSVQALDAQGNKSKTTNLGFTFVKYVNFSLATDGGGKVTGPVPKNGKAVINTSLKLTAVANPGKLFQAWEIHDAAGTRTRETVQLSFTPESDTTIVAHFIVSPYLTRGGVYNSALGTYEYDSNTGNYIFHALGTFSIAMTKTGHFTGSVLFHGVLIPVQGQLDNHGNATVVLKKNGKTYYLWLSLDFSNPDAKDLSVTLNNADDFNNNGFGSARTGVPAGVAPHYTATLGDPDSNFAGQGYLTLSIDPKGNARVVGALPDGTPFSAGATVQSEYVFRSYDPDTGAGSDPHDYPIVPIYAQLAPSGGLLYGVLHLDADEQNYTYLQPLHWHHAASAAAGDFEVDLNVEIVPFVPAAPGHRLAPFTSSRPNGKIALDGAGTGSPAVAQDFTLSVANSITLMAPAPAKTKFTLNVQTGFFTGTLSDGTNLRSLSGVLLQSDGIGYGLSVREGLTDQVTLSLYP